MALRKSRIFLGLIIVLVLVGIFIYRWEMARSVQLVPMARIERHDLQSGVVTNGKSEPIEFRDVRAEIEGMVASIAVHEGDAVSAGQVLATISQRQIASEVEKARADLADAESAVRLMRQGGTRIDLKELQSQSEMAKRERDVAAKIVAENERLYKSGAVARIDLEQSKERLAKAESDLALLNQKLTGHYDTEEIAKAEAAVAATRAALDLAISRQRSSAVVSPLSGAAYSLIVRAGDFVRPGDPIVRVGNLSEVRLRVYVDEPDLGRVTKGLPVVVTWDGHPGKQWRGTVDRLPAEIKELGTRKVGEVDCLLPNPSGDLLPNMNLNVEIISASKQNAVAAPREALFGTENNRKVYLVKDGKLVGQQVKTGIMNLTRVEIVDGLKEGDTVALFSETPLREGMLVSDIAAAGQ